MYQNRRDRPCISAMAPAANSLRAASITSMLNARSSRMNVASSFSRPASSMPDAIAVNSARCSGVARRAAQRASSRSSSRRTSRSRNWLRTFTSETMMPRRRRMTTNRSRARRCSASRMGMRPIPSRRLRIASETTAPGFSCKVTICSSSSRYARSASVRTSAALARPGREAPCALDASRDTALCRCAMAPGSDLTSPFYHVGEFLVFGLIDGIGMVVVGKFARFHLLDIPANAIHGDFRQIAEPLGELGLEVGEDAEQVIAQQDLPVGAGARADSDRRDRELLRDQRCDRARHGLELEHETTGILDGERILKDLERIFGGTALNPEAAEHGDGMGRESDMGGGRNACINQRLEDMGLAFTSLRFDR